MDENQLWATLWKCAATFLSILAVSIASCTAHQNYVQTQAMKGVQNPSAVQCSFGDRDMKGSAFCVEVAKH
jgi:hypothetical protein